MYKHDLVNWLVALPVVAPTTAKTGDVPTPTVVDQLGGITTMFNVNIGATAETLSDTLKLDIKLQDSDDNVTFADVTSTNGINGVVSISVNGTDVTSAGAVRTIQYIGPKRYVKALVSITGTMNTGIPLGITALKGGLYAAPNGQ